MKIKIPYKSCNLSSKQIETIKRKIRQKQKTQKIKTKPKSQVTKYVKQLFEKQKNKTPIIPLNIYQVWHDKSELPKSVKEDMTDPSLDYKKQYIATLRSCPLDNI